MSDTFDMWKANPSSINPLTAAVIDAMPKTMGGGTIGPTASDKSLRALLDALNALEGKQIAHGW